MKLNSFNIPKETDLLDRDLGERKKEYMDHLYASFKSVLTRGSIPEKFSVFQFKNTQLEVIIKKPSYQVNLKNLLDYYSDLEEYEICTVIKDLINKVNNDTNINDNKA